VISFVLTFKTLTVFLKIRITTFKCNERQYNGNVYYKCAVNAIGMKQKLYNVRTTD